MSPIFDWHTNWLLDLYKLDFKTLNIKKMKASVIKEFGGFDVLKYEEIETPQPKAGSGRDPLFLNFLFLIF